MRFRWHNWTAALLVVAACAAIAGGLVWYRSRKVPPLVERMHRLPAGTSVVYLDFENLRTAGLLALLSGQNVTEDADYQAFVRSTGFDYRSDLDSALVGFLNSEVFIVATGRFDWKAIQEHTKRSSGICLNGICRLPASTPQRTVSFVPLHSGMIGMAVSRDPWAVMRLQDKLPNLLPPPDAPVWAGSFGEVLRANDSLPAGTKLFVKALGEAKVVTLGLHQTSEGAELRLRAECANDGTASGLMNQLSGVTDVFRKYLENVQQKPNPADLSGVLTSGTFTREGSVVIGRWAVNRAFLEKLLSGQL